MGKRKSEQVRRTWNLSDLEGVDVALGVLAEIEAGADRRQADLERKIAALRDAAAADIARQAELAKGLRGAIEEWAEGHPAALAAAADGARSVALTHGRIGYRRTPPTIHVPKKVEPVIAALRRRGLAEAVIVKESVDRSVLARYDDATLKAVGARRKAGRDRFFIDLADEADAGRAAGKASA